MKLLRLFVGLSMLLVVQGRLLAAPQGPAAEARPRHERPPEPVPPERSIRKEDRHHDEEHRPPRLSPEERKALRQQIHEAGHDLYQPKK